MTDGDIAVLSDGRLSRLLAYLKRDPRNAAILGDAARAAYDAGQFALVTDLIGRRAKDEALSPDLLNLSALTLLAQNRFEDAEAALEVLRAAGHDAPPVRFNRAWALMMLARYEEADALLDKDAIAASTRGPALKIQALHHIGELEHALEIGRELAILYPDNVALMGALATLAIDAEELDLAQAYALRAGDNAEGITALGLFALDKRDNKTALTSFERALAAQPDNARAWVGKGLVLLAEGDAADAAQTIEHGARLFGDHLGSWVAAGWAHFLSGDQKRARDAFARVISLDGTFSEGHGGLAVLDLLGGNIDAAEQNSMVALRLDRTSLGGTLAKILLLQMAGEETSAEQIRAKAIATPLGPRGQTLAQMIAVNGVQISRG